MTPTLILRIPCRACAGTGKASVLVPSAIFNDVSTAVPCLACSGRGYVDEPAAAVEQALIAATHALQSYSPELAGEVLVMLRAVLVRVRGEEQ